MVVLVYKRSLGRVWLDILRKLTQCNDVFNLGMRARCCSLGWIVSEPDPRKIEGLALRLLGGVHGTC